MSSHPDTMKALVLHAVGKLSLDRIPKPVIGPGQTLIRIGFCGVCGSDIPRCFEKGTYHFPCVCGHEFAGTVEAVGEGVIKYQPGDRVTVFPLLWCGKCAPCEQGKYVQCHHYDYFGSRRDGAFAEYLAVPERNLLSVPKGVALEEAAMTEPAAVALHALRRVGKSLIGMTLAIFGAGPIGLMVAQWARVMGATRVVIFDLVPEKLDQARHLGFEQVYNSREIDPIRQVESLTGGEGAHVCVEAAGVPPALLAALSATRRDGSLIMLGNPSGEVTLPAKLISQAMRREVNLLGTWNSDFSPTGNDDDWHTVLEAMAAKRLNLLPLVTHRVPLEGAIDALTMMRDRKGFFSKVLVQP